MDEPESSSFIGAEEEAMHMEKVVAWNVKMLLTARRASQLALAEALGIKKAAMSRKINGYISWSLADVVKAARFLGTTPEDLMDDTLMKKMTDAPDHAHQGALVGAGSPRFLVSPFNPDAPVEGGISGAAKGALAGFVPFGVPSGSGSPSSPSKHDGIGVSGRSQAHETLRTMTTVIMHTSEGSITINLFDDKAPNTVANFLGLATGEKEWADPYTGQPSHGKFYNGLIFHRCIPAARYIDFQVGKEVRITGRTVRDSASLVLLLTFASDRSCVCTGCDDDIFCLIRIFFACQDFDLSVQFYICNCITDMFCSELLCLFVHSAYKRNACLSFYDLSRIVFYFVCVDNLAAGLSFFDDQGVQSASACI